MTYPRNAIEIAEAAMNYDPPENVSAAYGDALELKKVPRIVALFRILSPEITEIDEEGSRLLLGVCHMLNRHNFSELRDQALPLIPILESRLQSVE